MWILWRNCQEDDVQSGLLGFFLLSWSILERVCVFYHLKAELSYTVVFSPFASEKLSQALGSPLHVSQTGSQKEETDNIHRLPFTTWLIQKIRASVDITSSAWQVDGMKRGWVIKVLVQSHLMKGKKLCWPEREAYSVLLLSFCTWIVGLPLGKGKI